MARSIAANFEFAAMRRSNRPRARYREIRNASAAPMFDPITTATVPQPSPNAAPPPSVIADPGSISTVAAT